MTGVPALLLSLFALGPRRVSDRHYTSMYTILNVVSNS